MMLVLALMVGCGSKTDADSTNEEASAPVSTEALESLPVLTVEYPERGSFDNLGSGIVRGKVSSVNDDVQSVLINGETFSVDSTGRFEANMEWRPGIQILSARAEDGTGERAVDGRAFYAGPVNEPKAWIPQAIRMSVDAEVLDDDDPEPDDIAGLIQLALSDGTLLDPILNEPIELDSAVLTPTEFSFTGSHIDLVPNEGVLDAVITLDGVEVACEVQELLEWVATSGTASASTVEASVRMIVTSVGGDVRAETSEVDVFIAGLEYDVVGVPDVLESVVNGWVNGLIETAIEDAIREVMSSYVEDALEALAVGTTFTEDLGMELKLAGLNVVSEGVRFEVDAMIEALSGFDVPPSAGSMLTVGEAPPWPADQEQPLWVAIDDDLLNQLGFAFWQTGLVTHLELDPVLLGGLSGGPIPPPLGPIDSVLMNLALPPTIEPSIDPEWSARLAIGEWQIQFLRDDGEVFRFSINFRSNVQVDIGDDGEIDLQVDARPSKLEQSIGVLEAPETLDPGDLGSLVRLMIPPLLGNAASFAPDVPIPVLPLGEFISTASTEDLELVADEPDIHVDQDGWLILSSGLIVR